MQFLGPGVSTQTCYAIVESFQRYTDILWGLLDDLMKKVNGNEAVNIKKHKFVEILWYNNIDLLSGGISQETGYVDTVKYLSKESRLGKRQIEEAMTEAYNLTAESSNETSIDPIYVQLASGMTKVNVGRIIIDIPAEYLQRIFNHAKSLKDSSNAIARLIIRYSTIGVGSGLFWSAPLELYRYLAESTEMPVIECFASPFNHTLINYCSAFPEDISFGSLGNFFDYIEVLIEKGIKCRLSINPPYTESIVDRAIKAAIKYVTSVPEGEVFMMLPAWNHLETEPIISPGLYRKTTFNATYGNYRIYNYGKGQYITPPMDTNFIVLSNLETKSTINMKTIKQLA